MSELEALLLGIVQGLTEFLPISSSGHLILVPWLQDYTFLLDHPHFNKTFDVALHVGTLVAAIGYFRNEVVALTRGFLEVVGRRAIETPVQRLSVAIAVGTIPAAVAGGIGAGFFEDTLGEPWMIALQLIFFGALLLYAARRPLSRPRPRRRRPLLLPPLDPGRRRRRSLQRRRRRPRRTAQRRRRRLC